MLRKRLKIRDYRTIQFSGGCSSDGRASALQALCQEFDSPQLHQQEREEESEGQAEENEKQLVGLVAQLVRARA